MDTRYEVELVRPGFDNKTIEYFCETLEAAKQAADTDYRLRVDGVTCYRVFRVDAAGREGVLTIRTGDAR
jgi:hypothetical protein